MGMGGLDIFYIRREGDGWSKPKNIGYPINSPEDELGIFVSTSGRIAYFSSFKEGNWNIYAFNLYKEARPEEVVIIKGTLASSDGEAVKNAKVSIHYDDTNETQQIAVNEEDGSGRLCSSEAGADDVEGVFVFLPLTIMPILPMPVLVPTLGHR